MDKLFIRSKMTTIRKDVSALQNREDRRHNLLLKEMHITDEPLLGDINFAIFKTYNINTRKIIIQALIQDHEKEYKRLEDLLQNKQEN